MAFLSAWPVWLVALIIFVLRILDVSLGTVRTISVVQGRIGVSVVLGFFEVLIWVVAISQVVARIHESFTLALAYAGGFAAGNAVGILVDRKLALGNSVVRLISMEKGSEIAAVLRGRGLRLTTFLGEGRDGPRTLIYAICPRRMVRRIVGEARRIDPRVIHMSERVTETNLAPAHPFTGWRAVVKKK